MTRQYDALINAVDIDVIRDLDTYYFNSSLLDIIFLAAKDPNEPLPDIPYMPDAAQSYLHEQAGRLTLSSWAVAASQTKQMLDMYTALSFDEKLPDCDSASLELACEAQAIALTSLREHVCRTAGIPLPPETTIAVNS